MKKGVTRDFRWESCLPSEFTWVEVGGITWNSWIRAGLLPEPWTNSAVCRWADLSWGWLESFSLCNHPRGGHEGGWQCHVEPDVEILHFCQDDQVRGGIYRTSFWGWGWELHVLELACPAAGLLLPAELTLSSLGGLLGQILPQPYTEHAKRKRQGYCKKSSRNVEFSVSFASRRK